jgi:predicted Fe-Mo cluster-binding NifX family protein
MEDIKVKIAIPTVNGVMSGHFGHCEKFYIAEIKNNEIIDKYFLTPPPHEFGVFPKWLAEEGVSVLLCGGIGYKAIQIFNEFGVQVISGIMKTDLNEIIRDFLNDSIVAEGGTCHGSDCH